MQHVHNQEMKSVASLTNFFFLSLCSLKVFTIMERKKKNPPERKNNIDNDTMTAIILFCVLCSSFIVFSFSTFK